MFDECVFRGYPSPTSHALTLPSSLPSRHDISCRSITRSHQSIPRNYPRSDFSSRVVTSLDASLDREPLAHAVAVIGDRDLRLIVFLLEQNGRDRGVLQLDAVVDLGPIQLGNCP